jgi:hypothetical protein
MGAAERLLSLIELPRARSLAAGGGGGCFFFRGFLKDFLVCASELFI